MVEEAEDLQDELERQLGEADDADDDALLESGENSPAAASDEAAMEEEAEVSPAEEGEGGRGGGRGGTGNRPRRGGWAGSPPQEAAAGLGAAVILAEKAAWADAAAASGPLARPPARPASPVASALPVAVGSLAVGDRARDVERGATHDGSAVDTRSEPAQPRARHAVVRAGGAAMGPRVGR